MDESITKALMVGPDSTMEERVVDITTIGRRSGEPRRIETTFRRVGDEVYLSGLPFGKPRAWLLNLEANPEFIFHLKNGPVADLAATATVITDESERRRLMAPMVEDFERRWTPDSPYQKSPLEDWVASSPLALVTFRD